MRLQNFRTWLVAMALSVAIAGCGGGDNQQSAGEGDLGDGSVPLSQMTSLPSENPQEGSVGKATAGLTGYVSQDDPQAVYTLEDIPDHGRYPEIDFSGLDPERLNRVVHRLRTEMCSCGCTAMTIDMCLYDDPDCAAAPEHAQQIIREEQRKGL